MHVVFVSDCRGRAIRRTRAVLDSYAVRTSDSSWATPITQQALAEVRSALGRTATRLTAVACYVNSGRRDMRLAWIVGSRSAFGPGGHFRAGTTRKSKARAAHASPPLAAWVRIGSMLARVSGLGHDIGKASDWFQGKLRAPVPMGPDDIRHEWLSMRLLQLMRANGKDWSAAWQLVGRREDDRVHLGARELDADHVNAISDPIEAIDFLIVSHHGLLESQGNRQDPGPFLPTAMGRHVRCEGRPPAPEQVTPACAIDPAIFDAYWKLESRLQTAGANRTGDTAFWRGVSIFARAGLILADHSVSKRTNKATSLNNPATSLFANTMRENGHSVLNQSLDWHLRTVGEVAGDVLPRIARLIEPDPEGAPFLPALSPAAMERISMPADPNSRLVWQNHAANALENLRRRNANCPVLVFNMAGTGSGKTRMNLRTACLLARGEAPRIAVALNLRSLTLQTGEALRTAFELDPVELAVVIGEAVVQQLFEADRRSERFADDDENPPAEVFQVSGQPYELPPWLSEIFEPGRQRAVLGAPVLVSTIDYLIAAGNPGSQGHHVRALLRVISSDLVLDEIDSYEPESLVAVLRLVQLAALAGRNVICSSATLSLPVAAAIERAWRSGIEMRGSMLGGTSSGTDESARFVVAMIDDQLAPLVVERRLSEHDDVFTRTYGDRLTDIAGHLACQPIYRLACLQPIPGKPSVESWRAAVFSAIEKLHSDHCWTLNTCDSEGRAVRKRVSFGLVRVANIRPAIDAAISIGRKLPNAHVACYHAAHFLVARYHIEHRLDRLLARAGGDAHISEDPEIAELVARSPGDDVMFVVFATPVEEIGRDHDFDWAVIDVSSAQSTVQTGGRVNRHRLLDCRDRPNIRILQFNYRHCDHDGDAWRPAFIWPGYEDRRESMSRRQGYGSHDLATLLPWNEAGQLVIDARLRIDTGSCKLAAADEAAITKRLKPFFGSEGVFCASPVHAWTLTDGPAGPYSRTPLRDSNGSDVVLRVTGVEPAMDFRRQRRTDRGGRAFSEWLPEAVSVSGPIANAWLGTPPSSMLEICERTGVDPDEGMRVTLTSYESKDSTASPTHWTYDLAFGLMRQRK